MSLSSCASAAVATFPAVTVQTSQGALPLPVVMVEIAGAESNWRDTAAGDAFGGPYSCGGFVSQGQWQIEMAAHYPYLQSVTGSTSPCAWAQWLYNPANCAKAALAVYQSQGLGAWTTYTDGRWVAYLSQAQQAVAAAQPSVPPQSSATTTASGSGGLVLLALAGVALSGLGAYEGYETLVAKHGHSAPFSPRR